MECAGGSWADVLSGLSCDSDGAGEARPRDGERMHEASKTSERCGSPLFPSGHQTWAVWEWVSAPVPVYSDHCPQDPSQGCGVAR